MMNPDETIFSARSITRACWGHSNTIQDEIASGCQGRHIGIKYNSRVDWAEMPFDSTDFFLKDFVPESGFEFALAKGCGSHGHGFLATTE